MILTWILANLGTLVIIMVLLAVVGLIIWGMLRDRRKGKCTCGCSCQGCAMGGICHPKKK